MTALATDSGRKTPARLAGSAVLALQSDDRLVKLVRSGHERAFEAIVERYRKPLVRYCARILPESRCEDAVQQAFINAHTAMTSSDDAVQLKPWLFAITRNAALNMLRQNGWNYDQIPLDFDGVRRPDQVFEERSELERTVAALNELPERQRDALVMREFEGRSYNEIAVALGANDGAVRQLLNRARVTLRGAMSALIPPPLVARAAASLPPSDGRRMAELISGLSAAGVAKAGATALVAGSLVVGAVEAPLPIGASHKTTRQKATLSAAGNSTPAKAAHNPATPVVHRAAIARPRTSGESHSGRSGSHETEHRGSGETEHHSSRGETREESRSGSDDGTRNRSGSSDDSVTRTESGERSGSGRSGSGSDDVTTTAVPETTNSGPSLSSGSGSGSDDSVTSGSGSSGSGTSGSGTSSPETSGSGTSGSGTSGSGTSGSGSGSDDGLTTHD
jgi:RNA polymerase sigma factor (sigma-70 family)